MNKIIPNFMSNCTSYTYQGLNLQCKNSIGGIQEVYIGYYKDLLETIVSNNILTPVMHRGPLQKLFKFELGKNTASMTSTLQTGDAASSYFQTELSMVFLKQDSAKRIEMMALANADVFAIVKDKNGKLWFLGKDEPLSMSAATATTGQARSDANEYTLTLIDESNELPYEVSPEALKDLLTDWSTKCLAIEILSNGTSIKLTDNEGGTISFGFSYTVINKEKYETLSIQEIESLDWNDLYVGINEGTDELSAGDIVLLQSVDPVTIDVGHPGTHAFIYVNNPVFIYGNIASLFDLDYVKNNVRTLNSDELTIYGLFYDEFDVGNIMTHPTKELVIPFTNMDMCLSTFAMLFENNTLMEYGPAIYTESLNVASDVFSKMFVYCENLRYVQANFLLDGPNSDGWLDNTSTNGVFRTSLAANANNRGYSGVPNNWKLIVG